MIGSWASCISCYQEAHLNDSLMLSHAVTYGAEYSPDPMLVAVSKLRS